MSQRPRSGSKKFSFYTLHQGLVDNLCKKYNRKKKDNKNHPVCRKKKLFGQMPLFQNQTISETTLLCSRAKI